MIPGAVAPPNDEPNKVCFSRTEDESSNAPWAVKSWTVIVTAMLAQLGNDFLWPRSVWIEKSALKTTTVRMASKHVGEVIARASVFPRGDGSSPGRYSALLRVSAQAEDIVRSTWRLIPLFKLKPMDPHSQL